MSDEPQRTESKTGTIVVGGTGRVSVEADLADLRLGVSVTRPTVDTARAVAAETMDAILAAVADAGLDRRDVRTTLLSVQPRYDYRENRQPVLTGYELANVVEVTVRDLARLGDVVDGTLRAGATSMDGLSFRVADPAPAEREARLRAIAAARARAEVLAEAAGLAIVSVSDIVEGGVASPPEPRYKAARMMVSEDASTPVEAGSLEIAVSVTVTYRAR
jgi:uncharacterized protein YggE